jgi:hypothetical protein
MTARRQVANLAAMGVKVSTQRSASRGKRVTQFAFALPGWQWHGTCFSYLEP